MKQTSSSPILHGGGGGEADGGGARIPSALLTLRNVTKRYGAVEALRGIDLDVTAGEVLAICGDNGAGKSTLIRILSGAETPTAGTMTLRNRPITFRSPHDALAGGVATIYQDLALIPRLSVAANVFLGAERTRGPFLLHRRMIAETRGYLARLGVTVDPSRPVAALSGGQRQAVAICRALLWDAPIVIMDEPTAALGVRETAGVLALIRALNAEGRTVIIVSHDMNEVAALASRVVVFGGGRKVADRPVAGLDPDGLLHLVMASKALAA